MNNGYFFSFNILYFNSEILDELKSNDGNNAFKNVVNDLLNSKKKTEDLFNAILTSEVTTDYFDGPFGKRKSKQLLFI